MMGTEEICAKLDAGGSTSLTPTQAIAATVSMEKWEPSKEWKAWYNSLKHDNPTSIREAVENILYEAIDFGGDMGPNGNVWNGVDEGTVLTENCIDGWVESVESIAATVTTEPDEATMLKLHDRMNAALLDYKSAMGIDGGNGANAVPFVNEMHQIIEDAAKVGVGTCEADDTDLIPFVRADSDDLNVGYIHVMECSVCGGTYEHVNGSYEFCPRCGKKVVRE
jgi:hypothetical protein